MKCKDKNSQEKKRGMYIRRMEKRIKMYHDELTGHFLILKHKIPE